MIDSAQWEPIFTRFLQEQGPGDAAHDLAHVRRVVATARRLAASEGAQMAVVYPAAWLHDCVAVAKDDPDRPRASRLAAERAVTFLAEQGYAPALLDDIGHAIASHSFSAGIAPRTVEARVVQDADRLDALGAIGIARCVAVGTTMHRPLYHPDDPFCRMRRPDDSVASIDHFYTKLFTLEKTMQTAAGRAQAQQRTAFLRAYLAQLESEIRPAGAGGAV